MFIKILCTRKSINILEFLFYGFSKEVNSPWATHTPGLETLH